MAETAVVSLHQALAQHLRGRVTLYDEGEVPPNSPRPYAVLGAFGEGTIGNSHFMRRGHSNTVQIRWWGDTKYKAMLAFAAGKQLLDGWRLGLPGLDSQRVRLDYTTDFPEPDKTVGGHVIISTFSLGTRAT